MNYPTGYEKVNGGDAIKPDWLFYDKTYGWKLTGCICATVPHDMIKEYCRPIKHHSSEYSDLSPLPLYRFLVIGEEIKRGDQSYYKESGWNEVTGAIGLKLHRIHVPICRPIEQPNKESNMLVLELKTYERYDLPNFTKSNGIILFKIVEQKGFNWGRSYSASNGIKIKSVDCPAYSGGGTFYLRGEDKDKDNTILAVTEEEFAKIQAAVKEIIELENRPKFIQTITFKSAQTGKRHKVNVISNDGQDLNCVDCDTNEKSIFSVSLLKDIQSLPNAF